MSVVFRVDKEVFEMLPKLKILVASFVLPKHVAVPESDNSLQEHISSVWSSVQGCDIKKNTKIEQTKNFVKEKLKLNPKKFPMSSESLYQRACKGNRFHINPVVDYYNSVSIQHVITAGGFDLCELEKISKKEQKDFTLGFSNIGDRFSVLGGSKTIQVAANELSYLVGKEVLTRHFAWRQSKYSLIGQETERFMLIFEFVTEKQLESYEEVKNQVEHQLKAFFKTIINITLSNVDYSNPVITLCL